MALEQSGPQAFRLRRTTAAKTLDPSEKGAINYFLGLTISKLFADRLLGAPWMLHLDVFRPQLNAVLTGRSRPDLVGQTANGDWVALECKGRLSRPSEDAKEKAKQQALRLTSINGAAPSLHVGAVAYFRNDVLQFFWRDPPSDLERVRRPIPITVKPDDWRYYYLPILEVLRSDPKLFSVMLEEPTLMSVDGLDFKVGIQPRVLRALNEGQWAQARQAVEQIAPDEALGVRHADGVMVVAGPTWQSRFREEAEGA